LTDLRIFFTERFLGKFAVKWILKIPPHLAYVATLPCETLMSEKNKPLTTNYKQRLIAEFLSEFCFKSVNIWQSYKQESDCLVHFVRLANTLLKD